MVALFIYVLLSELATYGIIRKEIYDILIYC